MRYKFSDLYYDDTKNAKKLKSSEYKNIGKYIIVDQGKSLIAGYTDNEDGLYTDVPVIIFGDHTRNIKYINSPFFLGADGTKVLKSSLKNANYKYLYYLLKNASIPDTGYNRHYKWLKELMFEYHSQEQQNQIVTILDKLDLTISKYREELLLLDELVKARFVEMFGDPIYNTQNRPMTEFINVVKMQRVYDLPVQDRNHEGSIPVYGANGVLGYHDVAKINNGGIITGRSGTIGKVYLANKEYWPLNTSLFSIETYGNNLIYLQYLVTLYDLKRFVEGTGVPTLNRNMFHNKKIIEVPINEQNTFASFVEEVDKSRSRIQKSLEASQELFDSLMQDYFG